MATAEEMRARFEERVRPPGQTDERLAATLGLVPAEKAPPNGKARWPVTAPAPLANVVAQPADMEESDGGGGVGLEAVAHLFPAPGGARRGRRATVSQARVPVPVPLMREVARLEVDLSRHLARRVSNHEIGAAALGLLPADPVVVADQLRRHAPASGSTLRRRLLPVAASSPPSRRRRRLASRTSSSAWRRVNSPG